MRTIIAMLALAASAAVADVVETYTLDMALKVPQVEDNMASLGRRRYRTQRVRGQLHLEVRDDGSAEVSAGTLVNRSFRLNGSCVTYSAEPAEARYVYVGDNRLKDFCVPCVSFALECQPSYVKGMTDDSTLVLHLSGHGTSVLDGGIRRPRKLSGRVTGTLGCGCAEYGHVSPTRTAGPNGPDLSRVTDVAPVHGSFTMKWAGRCSVVAVR